MASKSLLNMHLDRSLPPHTDSSLLPNDMGEFFITKIANIRSKWIISLHRIFCRRWSLIWHLNLAILYCLISNARRLKQYVTASGKKKSCILNPIPVTLLSACLQPLLPAITNMVNLSLRTRYFANALKTAVVHPLLKKPGQIY